MMKMSSVSGLLILSICSIVFLSCSKGDPITQDIKPVITSATPLTGGYNTIVTIIGNNFSSIASNNIVKINGNIAAIVTAETNKLVVSVPLSAGSGAISVTLGNYTVSGPTFNYVSNGIVITVAGTGILGHTDGASNIAQFNYPYDIALDNQDNIYVSDNFQIRKITSAGLVSTLAGNGIRGLNDGPGNLAMFNTPSGIAVDAFGNVYVADRDCIRKILPNGNVSTLAGSAVFGYEDGTGGSAKFWEPKSVTVDAQGNLFVTDRSNYRIRKVTSSGIVTTVAGKGTPGYANGTGVNAEFFDLGDITVDAQGNIFVIDAQKIRKITPTGVVSTYAGSGNINVFNGIGANADFDNPGGLCIDKNGNIYIGESSSLIRRINSSAVVSTFAGSIPLGYLDGAAEIAKFRNPKGVATDALGNIYVADFANHRIRKILIQ